MKLHKNGKPPGKQLDLFQPRPRPSGFQLQLTGDDLKQAGISQVLGHTPLSYRFRFETVALGFPPGETLTSETITRVVGQPPGHANTVGALINGLAKAGVIVKTGVRVKAVRANQHSAMLEVWRRT